MSDDRRIENLEWAVRRLTAEVEALRAQVAGAERRTPVATGVAAEPAAAPTPAAEPRAGGPSATPRYDRRSGAERRGSGAWSAPDDGAAETGSWPLPTGDVESFVGRYGALALAALTILLGVGAFIGWAVEHVRLGPEARVALGALGAAAIAALGFRLRARGARAFGNALLALSLALVHLVAWGAGPYLHLVPDEVALGVSDVAAIALAILALREREQTLFVVGLGGALVAPFVFTGADGNVWALLAYGLVLRAVGARAVGEEWQVARRVLGLGASAYALATLASVATEEPGRSLLLAPGIYLVACAAAALIAAGPRAARLLALGDLATLVLVIAILGAEGRAEPYLPALALAGTAVAYAALARGAGEERRLWLAGAVPLALLAAAVVTRDDPTSVATGLIALTWAGAATAAALADVGRARGAHLMVAGLTSGAAVALASVDHGLPMPVALAAHGALFAVVARWLDRPEPLLPAAASLLLASGSAMDLLGARVAYAYPPFGTPESAAMAAVVAGWAIAAALAYRIAEPESEAGSAMPLSGTIRTGSVLAAVGGLTAFAWGRQELAWAVSSEAATFLLIGYYAAVGTGALLVGRWRGLALARRAGLALAIFAALKALLEASDLQQTALRVGSYLLVGAFLLAVAYWYRGEEGRAAA